MPDRARTYKPKSSAPSTPARSEVRRGSREERGYGWPWRRASKAFLKLNPVCVKCKERGRVQAATVVDHITPHKGNETLFWDQANWQPLCVVCHNRKSATE